jgi:hypothetical protein
LGQRAARDVQVVDDPIDPPTRSLTGIRARADGDAVERIQGRVEMLAQGLERMYCRQ